MEPENAFSRRPLTSRTWESVLLSMLVVVFCSSGTTAHGGASTDELKKLSLQELLDLEVTSVSRKQERAMDAATAIHVVTEEDIRRSGARSIPEALRLAPNLQVAQATARAWAISARGFNATFSNKMLVLIDGRTVYSPLFSGVFWDAQDTMLEDIDRIEVISGPGATVWGANAVNGVISIETKSAKDTQGGIVTATAGTEERGAGAFRYGGTVAPDVYFRVYGKFFERDHSVFADGRDGEDAWGSQQGGFRVDLERDSDTQFTFQGDIYDGTGEQIQGDDITQSGGNVLARWSHGVTGIERVQIQAYYDRTRQLVPGEFRDDLDTFDLDTQYERDLGERHHLMVGAGYRFTHNRNENEPATPAFLPATLDRHLVSAFVQDQITLSDRLKLTLGSKFEHNDYTGFEIQPSGRLAWTKGRHVLWGAISRAVRTPSRIDRHLFFPETPPFIFAGGPDFESEEVIAYELGWRVQPHENVFLSTAFFFNDYDNIRSMTATPPVVIENNVEGEIIGVELEATWQAAPWWRLSAGYTGLSEDLRVKSGETDLNAGQGEAFDPKHQFQLRSSFDLPRRIEFDVWARYVARVGNVGRGFGVIPAYVTLDMRIGWSPVENLELAIVGQNLLDEQHPEFGVREVERAVHGKVTWRF
jgi:iron complex outermembrane receptor protein